MKEIVSILIPTFNNQGQLYSCLNSIINARTSENLFHIYVINNGHKESCDWIDKDHKMITVIQAGGNLGWMGGLNLGLKHSKAEFVMFLNDDTFIPYSSKNWLNVMLQRFKDKKVAAVGPSTNVVMGLQNMCAITETSLFTSSFLIFYCVLLRRSALNKVGGVDESLTGGDDFDLSIRLRDKGYLLLVDKNVFVFHYGMQTGNRVFGDYTKKGGWNSFEYAEKVDFEIIKKHGFRKWNEIRTGANKPLNLKYSYRKDSEGELIRKRVNNEGKKILDLGCGDNKTFKNAIGVDIIPKGEIVQQLSGNSKSVADVEADVSKPLPFEDSSVDVVVARHILEHIIDPISAIKNWIKVVKKGGVMIICVPNELLIRSIPVNPEHVHAFTPDSLKTMIDTIGGMKVLEMWDSENGLSFTSLIEKI
jgi:glycosyltransferase involved in cell wall biosynthesis